MFNALFRFVFAVTLCFNSIYAALGFINDPRLEGSLVTEDDINFLDALELSLSLVDAIRGIIPGSTMTDVNCYFLDLELIELNLLLNCVSLVTAFSLRDSYVVGLLHSGLYV